MHIIVSPNIGRVISDEMLATFMTKALAAGQFPISAELSADLVAELQRNKEALVCQMANDAMAFIQKRVADPEFAKEIATSIDEWMRTRGIMLVPPKEGA